jgi:PAS domain S-box-containing protein
MSLVSRFTAALRAARSRGDWVWVVPHVVLGLFVLALFALLAVLRQFELESRRSAIAMDIQWAEQSIRSHLAENQAFLQRLAADLASGGLDEAVFRGQAAAYAGDNPELTQIVWVDADQVVQWVAPTETLSWKAGERLSFVEQALAFQRAHRTGLPAYAIPPVEPEHRAAIELYVPVKTELRSGGTVIGIYAADELLRHVAPHWFSEKYRVVLENDDHVFSASSSLTTETDLTESVALDPPGHGLRLRVSAFTVGSQVPFGVLVAFIAGLVVLMAWSLWALAAHTRRRLRAERERDRLFSLSLDLLCVLDLEGRILRASPAFQRVLKLAPEHLQGRNVLELVHPDDATATRAELRKLWAGEPSTGFENRCRCADGSFRWLVWSANPALDEKLLYCVAHDITDRKRAEDAVRSDHAFRKAMEESVVTGLRAVDNDGRITYVNPAFCEMVGYGAEELLGKLPPFPYWPEEELPALQAVTERWMSGNAPRSGFEVRIRRKSGERFHARMYISPLIDADGRKVGWMGSMVDISEQKRAQELSQQHQDRVQQTSRLITMGEMASSLAHELNQPLAAIANYCRGSVNHLRAERFELGAVTAAMEKASSQAERAGTIIRRMRDFVNKREPNRAAVAVADVVSEAVGFAEIDARKAGVAIVREVPADLPPIYADRVMIEQVVLNLVKNAVEAMHDARDARQVTIAARLDEAGAVEVAVADRGRGFGPEQAEKLFVPFFTTKPEGMGMGLSICRSIVEFHGGRLWAQSSPGGGSVFRFTLPSA